MTTDMPSGTPTLSEISIEWVNYTDESVGLSTGVVVPITDWYDADGDVCDPQEATVCVAGADAVGWFAIDLGGFEEPTVH